MKYNSKPIIFGFVTFR